MKTIAFDEAKERIIEKHRQDKEHLSTLRLSYIPNNDLFNEYKLYRCSVEDGSENIGESSKSEDLVYLCEIIMEVIGRGLLEDFNSRFSATFDVMD